MLEQRASRAVHDALRRAGSAGGEKDEQRVVEGELRELHRLRRVAGHVVRKRDHNWQIRQSRLF